MGLTVTRIMGSDASAAVRLVNTFARKEISIRYMVRFLHNPANYLLMADLDGVAVGFLLAYALERLKEEERMLFIYEIEVTADQRRERIGTALFEAVRDIAVREGVECAFVITHSSNVGAVAFYKHTGGERVDGDDVVFRYSWE